jgi:hypothetical protein
MDPEETSLGMPWWELDSWHLGLDVHQISQVGPSIEAADPDATMVELEEEHQDRESKLLAQISNLDDMARSYEERLDELTSTNSRLRKVLRNQEAGVEARVNSVQRQLDAAL